MLGEGGICHACQGTDPPRSRVRVAPAFRSGVKPTVPSVKSLREGGICYAVQGIDPSLVLSASSSWLCPSETDDTYLLREGGVRAVQGIDLHVVLSASSSWSSLRVGWE